MLGYVVSRFYNSRTGVNKNIISRKKLVKMKSTYYLIQISQTNIRSRSISGLFETPTTPLNAIERKR